MSLHSRKMQSMNQLKITHSVESAEDLHDPLALLFADVRVDGQPLLAGFSVDLKELAASTRASGDFWIFACGCGVPGCGGIQRGVVVTHSGGQTRWLVPRPVRAAAPHTPALDFEFDAGEYRAAVTAALTQVRSLEEEGQTAVHEAEQGYALLAA